LEDRLRSRVNSRSARAKLTRPYHKNKTKTKKTGDIAQVMVQHLLSKQEALGSTLITEEKKKEFCRVYVSSSL
jgi:hypothetical protein